MLRYCGPFLFAASIPLFYYEAGPAGPWASAAAILAVLLLAEAVSTRADHVTERENSRWFRMLVISYIPFQLALTSWAVTASVAAPAAGFFSLAFAVGLTTGVFGMLAAHEAIHSGDPGEGLMGTLMLTAMAYRHFRISHLHGHHRWAATERDAATARIGEGFYFFLIRTLRAQFLEALAFERRRCRVRKLSPVMNRVAMDGLVMVTLCGVIFLLAGWRGLLFFALQSGVAILVLELFNYIAHYGLLRAAGEGGRPEPLAESHSWNSSNILANAFIFNMGRHSFHHHHPCASYQSLWRMAAAPELPAGYAGSILLALFPPLWRRIMDKEAIRIRTGHPVTPGKTPEKLQGSGIAA